jgi:hypothetical protein
LQEYQTICDEVLACKAVAYRVSSRVLMPVSIADERAVNKML